MSQFKKEYLEIPNVLRKTINNFYSSDNEKNIKTLNTILNKKFTNILFSGMGSSYYAGRYISSYLNSLGYFSNVIESTDLAYFNKNHINDNTLIVMISRSGESKEVVQAINKINKQNYILGVTEESDGFLAKNSNSNFYIYGGEELAPTTKSYFCTLGVLLLLGYWLTEGEIDNERKNKLFVVADIVEELLNNERKISNITSTLKHIKNINITGRGPSLSVALQAGLVFKEEAGLPAEGFSTNDFEHGHNYALSRDHLLIILSNKGLIGELDKEFIKTLKNEPNKNILISDYEILETSNIQNILIPSVEEHLIPMLQMIILNIIIEQLKFGGKSNYLKEN